MRNKYSDQDLRIIDKLIVAGYGWREFALSVQKQGWITRKQSDTLCKMANDLSAQKVKATSPKYGNSRRNKYGEMYDYGTGDNFEYADYGGQGEYF
jgi:hypothetical protein